MILTQATKIKAVIRDRQIQLDSRYEELVRWFESQNLQRELEKKDDLFIDFVQAELHDFTGLSRKANSLDLKRARSYWSRRLGRAWTGKYGPSASEDTEKLRRINLALDAIQKTIEN